MIDFIYLFFIETQDIDFPQKHLEGLSRVFTIIQPLVERIRLTHTHTHTHTNKTQS